MGTGAKQVTIRRCRKCGNTYSALRGAGAGCPYLDAHGRDYKFLLDVSAEPVEYGLYYDRYQDTTIMKVSDYRALPKKNRRTMRKGQYIRAHSWEQARTIFNHILGREPYMPSDPGKTRRR